MMNDDGWWVFPFLLILVLISGAWYNFGRHIGGYEGRDATTISCIEKPEPCKERYKFLKLREKLGEN